MMILSLRLFFACNRLNFGNPMNSFQTDILAILKRKPLLAREVFDILQDEKGYYPMAISKEERRKAIDKVTKTMHYLKEWGHIHGEEKQMENSLPLMVYSLPNKDATETQQAPIPDEAMAEAVDQVSEESEFKSSSQVELENAEAESESVETIRIEITALTLTSPVAGETLAVERDDCGSIRIHGELTLNSREDLERLIYAVEMMM